jgi:FAD/FMN-containing dehydrogenase
VLGHLGDGNLHYNVEPPAGLDADAFASLEAEVHAVVYGEVDRLRGSISAEHGIGAAKVADLRRFKSGVELSLMQAIKRAIDPRGIMNPGKLFALEP